MRLAIFHNYYRFRGGEDVVFEDECQQLRERGHEVFPFAVHNEVKTRTKRQQFYAGWRSPFNSASFREITNFLSTVKADIGHVHNWFPVISPAIYKAHQALGIPVVQTLHNFRLGCAAATYFRSGEACHLCTRRDRSAALKYRCYRGSRLATFFWKRTMERNWRNRTFTDGVDAYIAPSQIIARRHIELGLPAEKVHVIPHSVIDRFPDACPTTGVEELKVGFLGRHVAEKGAGDLITAWRIWKEKHQRGKAPVPPRLILMGTGPEEARFRQEAACLPEVIFTGQLSAADVSAELRQCALVAAPGRWDEPFGLGVIEAFMHGRPVVTTIGGPAEIVEPGITGWLVPPADPEALQQTIAEALEDRADLTQKQRSARAQYEAMYHPEVNSRRIEELFRTLLSS